MKVEKINLNNFIRPKEYQKKTILCKGCENNCMVSTFIFENGEKYHAGNKCEKIFYNGEKKTTQGINQYQEKYTALFDRKPTTNTKLSIGIVRALGMYENYPFWHTLFSELGITIVLSDPSTMKMYETGISSIMADNICFPAKLVHGHIHNLISKKIDRIFMPYVVYQSKADTDTANSYNCPIVTAYSDVINSAIDTKTKYGIPLDAPTFTFNNEKLLKKAIRLYIKSIITTRTKDIDNAYLKAQKAQYEYEMLQLKRATEIFNNAEKNNKMIVLLAGRPYHLDPLIQHKIADIIADFGVDVICDDIVRAPISTKDDIESIMQWEYTNRILKSALWVARSKANVHYVQITSFGCGPDAFIIDEVNDILKRHNKNATILKVDDINNAGSTRLRIRSLIESLKFGNKKVNPYNIKKPTSSSFLKKDKDRTILLPWFSDFYSPLIVEFFKLAGYKAENLPPSSNQTSDEGLKYANNEVCYPATLVIGDLVAALKSGKYKSNEIALGITQTGGQCRATNYIALLKKALIKLGYNDIPIISISTSGTPLNEQPGFELKIKPIIKIFIAAVVFADHLSRLYYSSIVREKTIGTSETLKTKYIRLAIKIIRSNKHTRFYELMEKAKKDFSAINTFAKVPRIGIVGEIYIKYNKFGQRNLIEWLISQGVEPVLPPISDFFIYEFASNEARIKGMVSERNGSKIITNLIELYIFRIIRKIEKSMQSYPYHLPIAQPHKSAKEASDIINLNAQFGEGWGIPAEFVHFAKTGINNIVSLQPFGCIANHIVAKGIEKRTRQLYPSLNLLYLDFDSSTSEANIFNRMHFMVRNAKKELKQTTKQQKHNHKKRKSGGGGMVNSKKTVLFSEYV